MKPPFEDPCYLVTYGWRKSRDQDLKFVEMLYYDMTDYYQQAMSSSEQYVLINSQMINGRQATEIAQMNDDYDNTTLPIELGVRG